jgi:hypothetical protein
MFCVEDEDPHAEAVNPRVLVTPMRRTVTTSMLPRTFLSLRHKAQGDAEPLAFAPALRAL